jgi:hypothetical protein
MQPHSLPDPWEETTTKNPVEFTVRPTGELIVKGSPSSDIVQQLIQANDYHQDQNRRIKSEADRRIDEQSKMINLMTLGFLGSSILVSIICLFISLHNKQQQPQRSVNNGEFFRGTYCR